MTGRPDSTAEDVESVASEATADATSIVHVADDRRLVLSDLLNRVLDRGLVITGSVTIAVADVDLIKLDLNVVLTAIERAFARSQPGAPAR
jgi:hypothetical protein